LTGNGPTPSDEFARAPADAEFALASAKEADCIVDAGKERHAACSNLCRVFTETRVSSIKITAYRRAAYSITVIDGLRHQWLRRHDADKRRSGSSATASIACLKICAERANMRAQIDRLF
jgi:hypothetical protein